LSKVAQYLQEHLLGEVTASTEVRRHFAYDASIFRLAPAIVVYPRNETDIRKTTRFSWQLAQRGRALPITARGGGSDTSGAALSSGILLAFTAHMNKILALDSKKKSVTVEPGVTFDKLEQTLYTHGLFLPPYPQSHHYATIGGGLANNSIGEKSVKYGDLKKYVNQLRVVLANGEVIETGPLSKRELNKKLGQANFEGEIYRALDTLMEEHAAVIAAERNKIKPAHMANGYGILEVKKKDKFDLTPLFIGSQGTLGIISEASLKVVEHNPVTDVVIVSVENINDLRTILPKILELKPSICDMVNRAAIELVHQINPHQLSGTLDFPAAAIHLLIEFDDFKTSDQKKQVKKLLKSCEKVSAVCRVAKEPADQEKLWKVRQSVTTILTQPQGQNKAVPVAEDVCVPVNHLVDYLLKASEIYQRHGLRPAAWGQAGSGVVRMQPMLDLGLVGDRQRLFKLMEEIYAAAASYGGSLSAASGDGRIRAPYLQGYFGPEVYGLMMSVKKIFDPYKILNPGVKTASREEVTALMRGEYNLGHHHEHLPRS